MTRASKSYRATQKEPKESKMIKRKRLENYRVAKAQAKKFVIPGIILLLVGLFLLFGFMYGFTGAKQQQNRPPQDMIFEAPAAMMDKQSASEATRKLLANEISKIMTENKENLEAGKEKVEEVFMEQD